MAKTKVSRLAQIYRSERSQGRGLSSAIGKATLEKIDPRQFFNQQGLLASIFPSLFKAYKAPGQTGGTTAPTALKFSTTSLESKIENLSMHAKISARNSLVLPSMARDMNLTRQNIAKLVKLQGGKPSYKSDMFFMRAAEREAAYESQFKKQKIGSEGTKPTAVKSETGGDNIFSNLLKGFAIGSLIGAAIATIAALFKDKIEEIKNKIKELFDKITIDNLKEAAQNFINRLTNAIRNLPTGFGGTPGSKTSGGESPENPDRVSSTKSVGLGAAQDAAENAKRVGPKGEKIQEVNGVVGYYTNIGSGRGNQGKKVFKPLEGEQLISYYEREIKRVEELLGGGALTATQLSAQSFAKTEAGKVAIERYLKNKDTAPVPSPVSSSTTGASMSGVTFNSLSKEQQDAMLMAQAKAEGSLKDGSVAQRHMNPGNIIAKSPTEVYPAQAKFGGLPGETIKGPDGVTRTFVKFPSWEAGFDAQRDLWSRKFGNKPIDQALAQWAPDAGLGSGYNKTILASTGSPSSLPNLTPVIKSDGTKLATATTDVAQVKSQASSAPIIVSPPTVNVQAPQSQSTISGLGSSTSVIDSELMKLLVSRTVTL